MDSLWHLAKKAGIEDAEGVSSRFFPTFLVPLLIIQKSLITSLVVFLICLRLPHLYFWYLAEKRHRKIKKEIPSFTSLLRKALATHSVPEAICSIEFGETSRIFKNFCRRYQRGDDFVEALTGCAIFPELEELVKKLLSIHQMSEK